MTVLAFQAGLLQVRQAASKLSRCEGQGTTARCDLERIIAHRSELDALAEELTKRLQEIQAEREELVVAERVLKRLELPWSTPPRPTPASPRS
jgi:hypothetical protein